MTKYTDEQIIKAIKKAGGKKHPGIVYAWELSMYKTVIDHLPEPATDDWQQCSWGDILHTDERVKAEYISGTIIEGVPDGISDDAVFLVDSHVIPYRTDAKWYRIPAAVIHPNPAEHPVILIHRSSGIKHDPPAVAITRKHDMTDEIHYVFKDYGIQSPADITDWSPAKVVADND